MKEVKESFSFLTIYIW